MNTDEIARKLDTHVLDGRAPVDVSRAIASDRMSDLLENASPVTLIVTNLATPQLLDMAELMDVPAVCITSPVAGGGAFLTAASKSRAAVILSSLGPEETHRRLSGLLRAEAPAPP